MHRLVGRLVLYSELEPDGVLAQMAGVCSDLQAGSVCVRDLACRANRQAKRLLDLATQYGFDGNLWQDYLAFVLLGSENPFSLSAERRELGQGSLCDLALADFEVFYGLLHYDFSWMEQQLGVTAFSSLCEYRALPAPGGAYHSGISEIVHGLSVKLAAAEDAQQIYGAVCEAYRAYGVGIFGLNRAFRIRRPGAGCSGEVRLAAINNTDKVALGELVGYRLQKEQLVANTEAFLAGRPANNVLLYGDAGTGKSTSVKALLNEYSESGLRIIELYKHQFEDLSSVIGLVKNRNYRFIIFIDDLSFEENEVEYKFLKAVIEGGLESRPENVLIYATSNRRHLIREVWSDRADMEHDGDIHRSDTVQEKTSLAARFGVAINFSKPTPDLYHEIVRELAERSLAQLPPEKELFVLADRWGIRHGGISGRAAQQFVDSLAGTE